MSSLFFVKHTSFGGITKLVLYIDSKLTYSVSGVPIFYNLGATQQPLKEARDKLEKLESLVDTGESRGIFVHKTRDENIFEWS
jgi:hypothetical protein